MRFWNGQPYKTNHYLDDYDIECSDEAYDESLKYYEKEERMKTIRVQEHGLIFEGHPEDAKTMAEQLRECCNIGFIEGTLSDFTFALEVAYQEFYGLDEDDWERVDEETARRSINE